jgi:hypothetical protein
MAKAVVSTQFVLIFLLTCRKVTHAVKCFSCCVITSLKFAMYGPIVSHFCLQEMLVRRVCHITKPSCIVITRRSYYIITHFHKSTYYEDKNWHFFSRPAIDLSLAWFSIQLCAFMTDVWLSRRVPRLCSRIFWWVVKMVYPKVSGLSHNEIYAYNIHSLRSNTKGYGGKTQ